MRADVTTKVYGVLGEFGSTTELLTAAEKVKEAGYCQFDCYSPFPIHGMDKAMGLGQSKLGWIVFVCGASGLLIGLGLQWWSATLAYPLIISGKPLFSHQAFVPITFECTVLLSAFGAVLGMLALNKLPMFYHPLFHAKEFKKVTDSGFFVAIEAKDPKFDREACQKLLASLGASKVEVIEC